MISINIADSIREQVANDVAVVQVDDSRYSVSLPLVFDDGDPCGFVLSKGKAGDWVLSDAGDTERRADDIGVNLRSSGYRHRYENIVKFYGLKAENRELKLPVRDNRFSDAIFTFAQVRLEAVNLARSPKERHSPEASVATKIIGKVLSSRFADSNITPDWHHGRFDPSGIYRADYRLRKSRANWLFFGISGASSSMKATIACFFLKSHNFNFKSVAFFENYGVLRERAKKPLEDIANKTFQDADALAAFVSSIAK
jgi:hypothetical protein